MSADTPLIPDDTRPRGILTEADREFLRGKKQFSSEQSERDARYRIRQRTHNAILDFSILFNHLNSRDKNLLFDVFDTDEYESFDDFLSEINEEFFQQAVEDTMLISGVADGLAFFYEGTNDASVSFEQLLESAIENVEGQQGYVVEDINIIIDVNKTRPEIEGLKEKLKQGEPLTKKEITTLIRSGELEITSESLDRLFEVISEDLSEQFNDVDMEISLEAADREEE